MPSNADLEPLIGANPHAHKDDNVGKKPGEIKVEETLVPIPQKQSAYVVTEPERGRPLYVGEDSDLRNPPWNVPLGTIQGRQATLGNAEE